ncbi:hypothetical protein PL373_19395 [Tenacibaculum maritimum]|nr:hypothetical protein [Tenacibaculum maritimum]MDB0603107.1 hypothetical protein [Tenacibaculum maritimum]MDB0603254.1 hypothetical protein [Tenacibaculum maritimum]MDB0610326.1 hypothetical protein [Tenacibaculum maritimum]
MAKFRFKKGEIYCKANYSRFDHKGKKFKDRTIKPMIDCYRVWAYYTNWDGHRIIITAFQDHDSPVVKGKGDGAVWLKFKIFNRSTQNIIHEWAYFDVSKGSAYLKNANIMICCNSRKRKEGWCGPLSSDARSKYFENSKKNKKRR